MPKRISRAQINNDRCVSGCPDLFRFSRLLE